MSLLDPQRHDILAVLAVVGLLASAVVIRRHNDAARSAPQLEAMLEPDAERRGGTLDNGLRYYVRENGSPEHRAELRLVVNAGSVLEDGDQRGLAHAVEHMLFRGTRHFPGRSISNYLESIGMRGGQDVNATTSPDETIYQITIPTDRPEVLDSALAMLADMAHEATFDPVEARAEAGIVLSEWRSRRDVGDRLLTLRDSALLIGSRYGMRETIGDTAVLRRFDLGAMRRFYADWYRPELMGVVVVGDVDAAAAVASVRTYFGAIPRSATARSRPPIATPASRAVRVAALTDAEATTTLLSLWFTRQAAGRVTVGDYRARVAANLWRSILGERYQDVADQPGSPLLSASIERREPVRPLDAEVIDAAVSEDRLVPALDLILQENDRFVRHGPTPAEIERASAMVLRQWRQASQWTQSSTDVADGYVREFLTGDVFIGRSAASDLMSALVPTITSADLQAAARRASSDSGVFLLVTGPEGKALEAISLDSLRAHLRLAGRDTPAAASAQRDSTPWFALHTSPGRIASERTLKDIDTQDWVLENGMRVILKPSQFVQNQFEFRLTGSGGAALASDRDYPSAYYADAVLRSTGVGTLRGRELTRLLDGSAIDFNQSVQDDQISFRGYAAPRDMETLFQVIHLHFVGARSDTVAFRRFRERMISYNGRRTANPDVVFSDSVAAIVQQHRPRALRRSVPFLRGISLSRSITFWNARVANASSFTLVLSGDFAVEQARELVERYLAALPAGHAEQPGEDDARFPARTIERSFVAGAGPKARTQILVSGPYDGLQSSSAGLSIARNVAELALNERLRESLGGTYDVDVTTSVVLTRPSTYTMTIDFAAAPDRIDALAAAALAELSRLRAAGPSESEFVRTRAARIRDLDEKLRDIEYWADELSTHARMHWPLGDIADHPRSAASLTRQSLREACRTFLGTATHVRVTMYPRASPLPTAR
jgi:zinc protease